MCNHLVQKSFTLMAGIYRHAAQRVLEAGTGRRKVIIFVEETNAVIQVLVQLDSFFLQQGSCRRRFLLSVGRISLNVYSLMYLYFPS